MLFVEVKMNCRVSKYGTIHNLKNCCKTGEKIKPGNYSDVFTLEEAEALAKSWGKKPSKCKHCKWQ